jgi:sugar/nucleoside kinase (ribokinase family)
MTAAHAVDAPIVVIGGALADVRAVARHTARRGESVPGTARLSAGGTARNVAADLARFGRRVILLTAVGDDGLGRWVLEETQSAGVDTTHAVRLDRPTGMFVSVAADDLEPWCVSDANVVEALTRDHVAAWAPVIARAALVAADANATEPVQRAINDAAGHTPRVLLATSRSKSPRLRSVVGGAAAIIGSLAESRALLGAPDGDAGASGGPVLGGSTADVTGSDWRRVGAALVGAGASRAIVTLGPLGIGCVTPHDHIHVEALTTPVVDTLGAGDAVAAAVVHGLVAGMTPRAILTLAARAAAHVAQCTDVTPSSLRGLVAS